MLDTSNKKPEPTDHTQKEQPDGLLKHEKMALKKAATIAYI
jgi:hypothetical protein